MTSKKIDPSHIKDKMQSFLKGFNRVIDSALYTVFAACIIVSTMLIEHTWFFINNLNIWVVEKAIILLVVSLFMTIYGVMCRLKNKSAHVVHVLGIFVILAILLHIRFAYL